MPKSKKFRDMTADQVIREVFNPEVLYELKRIANGKPVKKRVRKEKK